MYADWVMTMCRSIMSLLVLLISVCHVIITIMKAGTIKGKFNA